ncbi:MAG: hypothetical protein IH862_09700 [Chloroflexi bacterium]|nr:hypothetical protein [Chloroflexota bacterium]
MPLWAEIGQAEDASSSLRSAVEEAEDVQGLLQALYTPLAGEASRVSELEREVKELRGQLNGLNLRLAQMLPPEWIGEEPPYSLN